MRSDHVHHSVFHQIDSLLAQHLPEPLGKQLLSWNERVSSPGDYFPPSLQPLSATAPVQGVLCVRGQSLGTVCVTGGGTKSRLGQTGPISFCLCICCFGRQKLIKNKTQRSSRGTGQPPSPLLPDLSRFPQARGLCQCLPCSPAEELGQSNCGRRSRQTAFCLLNYSNNNLGQDKGWHWEHQLCASLLM